MKEHESIQGYRQLAILKSVIKRDCTAATAILGRLICGIDICVDEQVIFLERKRKRKRKNIEDSESLLINTKGGHQEDPTRSNLILMYWRRVKGWGTIGDLHALEAVSFHLELDVFATAYLPSMHFKKKANLAARIRSYTNLLWTMAKAGPSTSIHGEGGKPCFSCSPNSKSWRVDLSLFPLFQSGFAANLVHCERDVSEAGPSVRKMSINSLKREFQQP